MAHIGIITYNYKHLKTEQVLSNLFSTGVNEDQYTLFALKFIYRSPRKELFSHRPNQFTGIETSEMAKLYDIPFVECDSDNDILSDCDLYIITGAGIISESCLQGKKIINCHAGIIPLTRGLDSFKWAIIDGKPVGNTLHYIDKNVDEGNIIAVRQTPLYEDDTLSSFAERHYDEEIKMLSNYKYYLHHPHNDFTSVKRNKPYRRMPITIEQELKERFKKYKHQYAISYSAKSSSGFND